MDRQSEVEGVLRPDRCTVPEHVQALVQGPCSLVVGGQDEQGAPLAAWAWGAMFVHEAGHGDAVRLSVEGDAHFAPGHMLAITGGDLFTTRSVQLKGVIVSSEDPTPDDLARLQRHVDGFVGVLQEVDGVARERALGSVGGAAGRPCRAYVVEIDAVFDQSPGPNAGTELAS